MLSRRIEIGIGLATLTLALLILFIAIPFGIKTPESVRSLFLSPTFWPTILGVCLAAVGAALAIRAYFGIATGPAPEPFETFDRPSLVRIAAFLLLITVYFLLIRPLGMVWASVLAFAAIIFLTGAPSKATGLICAVVLPLLLYAFFYHVAAVPIPQGHIVRLP